MFQGYLLYGSPGFPEFSYYVFLSGDVIGTHLFQVNQGITLNLEAV